MDIISCEINTDINSIKKFNNEALEVIKRRFDDKDFVFKLRLILDELIINSYKHGNKKVFDRKINCLVLVDDDYCLVKVKDEGAGIHIKNSDDPLAENGRGIMLVNAISDELVVEENVIAALVFYK
ncbi:ATP-binding protein [Anaerococcus tetradius]|uniref:Histidine kinase/HSP90-like ATPase domain-containing protein n=1 Tax=Anaerococcus tetradius TaxID=33036 RepID=A0A133KFL8_9FIRM|nr:ATP-binding protein [Anaerococcus tetradius]KWZ78320.1 hypothetical protein HMPREF3200_00807 [Anaerococcus tetradius]